MDQTTVRVETEQQAPRIDPRRLQEIRATNLTRGDVIALTRRGPRLIVRNRRIGKIREGVDRSVINITVDEDNVFGIHQISFDPEAGVWREG